MKCNRFYAASSFGVLHFAEFQLAEFQFAEFQLLVGNGLGIWLGPGIGLVLQCGELNDEPDAQSTDGSEVDIAAWLCTLRLYIQSRKNSAN